MIKIIKSVNNLSNNYQIQGSVFYLEFILIMIIGLCIGSFLNVCIYRIARDESIVFPASHCTTCGYELRILDLIPLISYIALRGRCRNCKEKISMRYPIVEFTNSLLYGLAYLQYGLSIDLIKVCIFISLLLVIALIDYDTQYVYMSTIIFGLSAGVLFLILKCIELQSITYTYIAGAVIGYSIIGLIVVLTGGMGKGDIDIALICGLFLGVKGIAINLFIAFIVGGILGACLLLFKKKGRKEEMAFGPFLALGAIVTILYGNKIFEMYMAMI